MGRDANGPRGAIGPRRGWTTGGKRERGGRSRSSLAVQGRKGSTGGLSIPSRAPGSSTRLRGGGLQVGSSAFFFDDRESRGFFISFQVLVFSSSSKCIQDCGVGGSRTNLFGSPSSGNLRIFSQGVDDGGIHGSWGVSGVISATNVFGDPRRSLCCPSSLIL